MSDSQFILNVISEGYKIPFFKFRHLLTGAKWFLCTQSFWKNNIKLSFLRCPALRRIPLSQGHHQIEFPSYCKWPSNPSSLKDPLPATLLRSMISAVKVLFVPRSFRLGRESFCFCHGVFVCALRVFIFCRGTCGPPYQEEHTATLFISWQTQMKPQFNSTCLQMEQPTKLERVWRFRQQGMKRIAGCWYWHV